MEIGKLFLKWTSFILLIFVLANGYLSLLIFTFLIKGNMFQIPQYDKIIISLLFGFFNFECLLYISKEVFFESDTKIKKFVGTGGIPLVIISLFFSVILGYSSYLLYYII